MSSPSLLRISLDYTFRLLSHFRCACMSEYWPTGWEQNRGTLSRPVSEHLSGDSSFILSLPLFAGWMLTPRVTLEIMYENDCVSLGP